MNMDAGGDGVLASAELVKEAEANASYACKTQTLTDEDRSFVSSLWVQFGDEDDEDISAAMMDKISRRLEAMQSRLIVEKEEEEEERDFVAQMERVDRFLRSLLISRLDSGRRLLEELLFFTLFTNAFVWGLSRDPMEGLSGGSQ